MDWRLESKEGSREAPSGSDADEAAHKHTMVTSAPIATTPSLFFWYQLLYTGRY